MRWLTTLSLLSVAALGLAVEPPTSRTSRTGLNLSTVSDWSTSLAFRNLAKQGRPWAISSSELLTTVNAQGHPTAIPGPVFSTVLLGDHTPAGTYHVSWEGTGQVTVDGKSGAVKTTGPTSFEVTNPGGKGLAVQVTASDAADPVRNVSMVHADLLNEKGRFHPAYVADAARFSTLRFMDWGDTNDFAQLTWDQRAQVDDMTWHRKDGAGVPIEVMVDLANETKAAPWFCMPTQANDEFVRQYALLVKERLAPGVPIYLEYSNEVWNNSFKATHYAAKHSTLPEDAPMMERVSEFYAKRSTEIFAIWGTVFADQPNRVKNVIATWCARPEVSRARLKYHDAASKAHYLAIAPYFGFNKEVVGSKEVSFDSVDAVLDSCKQVIDGPLRKAIKAQKDIADQFNLPLIAYEGGQHLLDRDAKKSKGKELSSLTKLFIEANRHPRMGELYHRYLDMWAEESGDGLMMLFAHCGQPSKYGMWGMKEALHAPTGSPTSIKWDAVLTWLSAAP